jgi:transposase
MNHRPIKRIPDSEATLLSNGEPLEITESVYRRAPVLFKWCNTCGAVTRHRKMYADLTGRWVEICDPEID